MKLRLEELAWNQTDLARELSKEVEATPAAISYLLTKAKQSALRPFIDKLLWPESPAWGEQQESRMQELLKDPHLTSTGARALEIVKQYSRPPGVESPAQYELVRIFDELDERYRGQLMIEARYLLALRRAEIHRSEALAHSEQLVDDLQKRIAGTSRRVEHIKDEARSSAVRLATARASERQAWARYGELVDDAKLKDLEERQKQQAGLLEEGMLSLFDWKKTESQAAAELEAAEKSKNTARIVTARTALDEAIRQRSQAEMETVQRADDQLRLGKEMIALFGVLREAQGNVEREIQRLNELQDQRRDAGVDPDDLPDADDD